MIGNLFFVSLSLFNTVSKPSTVDNNFSKENIFENDSEYQKLESAEEKDDMVFSKGTVNDDFDNREIITQANKLIQTVDEELIKFGSSVENELKKQKSLYNTNRLLKKGQEDKKRKKIEESSYDISSTLDEMATDYLNFKESNNEGQSPKRASTYETSTVAAILAAHAAIVTYFSVNNYTLSTELLTHMRENSEIDSIYRPVNSDIVVNSEDFKNLAYNSGDSSSFEQDSSSTRKQDLYYAIHDFHFSKSLHNDAIVLTDRYDFDPNSKYLDSIQESATYLMYVGQTMGALKPFYTVLSSTNNINVQNNVSRYIYASFTSIYDWQYHQVQLTLGYDDYAYVSFKFTSSGYRSIQTLGDLDTELVLYSGTNDWTQRAYDDDAGYKFNALINYYFQANISYTLLVRFYNYCDIGNVRVIFTPSTDSNYDNITQIKRNEGFFTSEYKDVLVQNNSGRVSLFTFAPALGKSFTIETTKKDQNQDTTLYFIDPRRGDSHYNTNDTEQLQSCIMDDDEGESYNAKISLNPRATNIPYLIIACAYSSSVPAKFNIKISGLNSSIFDNLLLF